METKSQLTDIKRKHEEEAEVVTRLEEIRKKNMKDLEELNHKLDEVQGANEKLEKSKRKLASELDDATHELDSHRAKVLDLEKKQRNFDKILAEEKLNADRLSGERDTAEREARDKETKLLNLNRELDDTLVRLEESDRSKRTLQSELDEVVNSQVLISTSTRTMNFSRKE